MNRAVVFVNGECSDYACSLAKIVNSDVLVCVDGGARHCVAAGYQPDLIVGDLDSVSEDIAALIENSEIECVRFTPEKDASDLELALRILCERSVDEVVLLGLSGGRTDHQLFNWQLAASRSWPFRLRGIDDSVDAVLVDQSRPLYSPVPKGQTFSVIPIVQSAKGVCITGAKYPLTDVTLSPGRTLGLSNEVTQARLQVSVEEGIVLVMLVHADIRS